MSFVLGVNRTKVAFKIYSGAEVEVDFDNVKKATCICDISSAIYMNLGEYGYSYDSNNSGVLGNFTHWIGLKDQQGVAVTGLTSCGAVFIANKDFSQVAAGHMAGDVHYFKDWIEKLKKSGEPCFMLWGSGFFGSPRQSGKVLMEYMKSLNIPPARAPAVRACGAIFLARAENCGIAYASHSCEETELPFQRTGQAVKEIIKIPEKYEELNFLQGLEQENGEGILDQCMLIYHIAKKIDYSPDFTVEFGEFAQKNIISLHGKPVIQKYLKTLSGKERQYFTQFEIFKLHPDWKS